MDENSWHGNLTQTPLPQLLLAIWKKKSSGFLRLQKESLVKALAFSGGDLALAEGCFSEVDFERGLVETRVLSTEQGRECLRRAQVQSISFPRALVESEVLSPSRVWELLAEFCQDDLYPLFDWDQTDYAFDAGQRLSVSQIFLTVPTLEFILRGIRRMQNQNLIEAFLPPDTETLQILSFDAAKSVPLVPHEEYLWNLLQAAPPLHDVYRQSRLGKKETQKVLFTLIQLGLAGLSQAKNKARPQAEISPGDPEKIWNEFNDKCSYIYKYISKEIGPVALNVLEKALEEVKSRLGPPLQSLELGTDGRLEFKSFPLISLNLHHEESRKNFLGLLNEILVAEVLAVKKTLGNAHESTLIKNLERIGGET